ncbi:methyltransferase domain-containing protein [Bdellovibrionota bacterium]
MKDSSAVSDGCSFEEFFKDVGYISETKWAWQNLKEIIKGLISHFNCKEVMEIGGGRNPLFSREECIDLGINYTINDIFQKELDLAPDFVQKVCFDASGDISSNNIEKGRYDLAFSRMFFEHVRDGGKVYKNIFSLLRRGGINFAFYPTLYSPPFVLNKFFPENFSSKLVRLLIPSRVPSVAPKFPAHYSWCFGQKTKMEKRIKSLGFEEALVLPFYGHYYFKKIAILRDIDNFWSKLSQKREWESFSSYAFSLARK